MLARLLAGKLSEQIGPAGHRREPPRRGRHARRRPVAKSPPDGYTILQNTNGEAIAPALYNSLPFDAINDFAPVTQLVASNLILVASPKSGIASMQQLIAEAKASPGKLNYG